MSVLSFRAKRGISDFRLSLADQQAALLAALAGKAPVPAGFDAHRIQAAASALAFKRARAVTQAWPSVCRMLGTAFRERFADYAANMPLPQNGGPLADGRVFVQYLAARMPLTDDTKMQALSFDVRFRLTSAGFAHRHLPAVRFVWLAQSRAVLAAFGARRYRFVLPRWL